MDEKPMISSIFFIGVQSRTEIRKADCETQNWSKEDSHSYLDQFCVSHHFNVTSQLFLSSALYFEVSSMVL